jgi:hypothetical protein
MFEKLESLKILDLEVVEHLMPSVGPVSLKE